VDYFTGQPEQTTMNKYLPIIQKINEHLAEFNSFLREQFAIPLLDESKLTDETYFLNPTGKGWNDCKFPRDPASGGVYFYMGISEPEEKEVYVYIGKASLTSTIGKRLYAHFRGPWKTEKTLINYGEAVSLRIELIGSIPIEKEMTFLAPALEEYLIAKLREDCLLLNAQGNN